MSDNKRDYYINEIKKSIEEKMKRLFERAHKYTENLSHEDIVKLHENHVKDVFYPYSNNLPALKNMVEIRGEEKVLEDIKAKFMGTFHFHEKMLKCNVVRKERSTKYTDAELLEHREKISKYIQELTTSIIEECKDLNNEELKEIHMFIFELIFNSDIEHITCFKKASETMNMDVINRIHNRKVLETINKYSGL